MSNNTNRISEVNKYKSFGVGYKEVIFMIKYKTEKAIVEVHFADLTEEERKKQHERLEQGLVKFYKEVIKSGEKWPESDNAT